MNRLRRTNAGASKKKKTVRKKPKKNGCGLKQKIDEKLNRNDFVHKPKPNGKQKKSENASKRKPVSEQKKKRVKNSKKNSVNVLKRNRQGSRKKKRCTWPENAASRKQEKNDSKNLSPVPSNMWYRNPLTTHYWKF